MNFSKIIDRVGRQSVRKVEFIALHDFVDLGSLPLHDAREHRNVRRETEERVFQRFEPLLDDQQAAMLLGGLHPKTLQRMARRGHLPAFRVGKYWRYRASELDEWVEVPSETSTLIRAQ